MVPSRHPCFHVGECSVRSHRLRRGKDAHTGRLGQLRLPPFGHPHEHPYEHPGAPRDGQPVPLPEVERPLAHDHFSYPWRRRQPAAEAARPPRPDCHRLGPSRPLHSGHSLRLLLLRLPRVLDRLRPWQQVRVHSTGSPFAIHRLPLGHDTCDGPVGHQWLHLTLPSSGQTKTHPSCPRMGAPSPAPLLPNVPAWRTLTAQGASLGPLALCLTLASESPLSLRSAIISSEQIVCLLR